MHYDEAADHQRRGIQRKETQTKREEFLEIMEDIQTHIRDIYEVELSDTTVSRITDKILPIVREWQHRPLESIYAVVFMDAIHDHVRSEGQIVKKAVYIAIGIDLEGRKDVLGMWVGENESTKYWATVLSGLKTVESTIFSLPARTI